VIIYEFPYIASLPLSNTLTLNNTKSGFVVRGVWLFNTDNFTDEDFCAWPSTAKYENVDNFGLSDSGTSNSNLNVGS
jgi:hypothetical protein